MNEIYETIVGEVVSKANHYMSVPCSRNEPFGERRIIKDQAIREYERSFMKQCKIYKDKNISCQFTFYCKIYYKRLSHDLDNSIKTILDCLQYCNAIKNDNLCMKIVAEKHHDTKQPRVEFAIVEHQPRLF